MTGHRGKQAMLLFRGTGDRQGGGAGTAGRGKVSGARAVHATKGEIRGSQLASAVVPQ